MNTYIIPFSLDNDVWIESVKAKSILEAQDKLMNRLSHDWELDVPTDWEDFLQILSNEMFRVGELKDIEEF